MIARLLWVAVALCVLGALPDAASGAPHRAAAAAGFPGAAAARAAASPAR